MNSFLKKETCFLYKPLNFRSRICVLFGGAFLLASIFLPLWKIRLVAPQYEEGLDINIYSYRIVGGNNGQDLKEINTLNHYIGMKPLQESDFVEMKLVPFCLGLFFILTLRAAVLGYMGALIDLLVLFVYFGLFSMGTFYYRLYTYGHNLDPRAPMQIEPFMPVLLGKNQIANFVQWSYPLSGSWLLLLFPLFILAAIWFSKEEKPLCTVA